MGQYNEMTRHAFMSHMEDYIKKLLNDPIKADTDDFLKDHGINGKDALQMLLSKTDDNDDCSMVITRKETIKNGGFDENGRKLKDTFKIEYKLPRKDYIKKMHKIYKKLYENSNIVNNDLLNEDECAGSTTCGASSGQYIKPLGEKKDDVIRRKTIYITQEQLDVLKQTIKEEAVMDTPIGDFGYDAPISKDQKNDFYKDALDHKDMMKKSWQGEVDEDIDINPKNKGKFTATQKRTGKSTEELTHSKNPLTRKRANFAKMAKRGWKPLKKD